MCKKLIYLVSFIFMLSMAAGAQAAPLPISADPAVEVVIGNDGIIPPDKSYSSYDLQIRDYSNERRVTLISFDISGLKNDRQMFANMSLSNLGANASGKVDVYGIIEDQDNISSGLKWINAPGVNNDQPTGYPVSLDEADLTEKLLSFTSPARDERKSTGTSQALDDFLNSDTDGIVTFLLAPASSGTNALMKSSMYSGGGTILEGEVTTGIDIVWVAKSVDNDGDGVQDDQGFVDFLNAEGHNVDVNLGYWGELDPNKVEELNEADLVIISRATSSGDHDDGDEPTLWNSVTTPMIVTTAYIPRSNKWVWVDNTSIFNMEAPMMQAVMSSNPLFDGIELDADNAVEVLDPKVGSQDPNDPNLIGQTTFLGMTEEEIGNGFVLANTIDGIVWIAIWNAGVEFYDGCGQIAGGKRMMFMAGAQEWQTEPLTPYGALNLNDNGLALLSNAVFYMALPTEIETAGEMLVDVSAADSSAGTETWGNNGTLEDFTFITEDDLAAHPDTKAMTPGLPPAVEEFEGVPVVNIMSSDANLVAYTGPISVPGIEGDGDRSIEAWVADINDIPSSQVIIAWGARSGDGQSCCFSYGTRNTFGALIHYGDDYDVPWGNNFDAPKDADGNRVPGDEVPSLGTLHHLVYTYEGTTVNLYVDGRLVVTRELGGPLQTIAGLPINLFVQNYRTDGGYHNNSLPASLLVNSIRVHDGVLTNAQVLDNYLAGPAK